MFQVTLYLQKTKKKTLLISRNSKDWANSLLRPTISKKSTANFEHPRLFHSLIWTKFNMMVKEDPKKLGNHLALKLPNRDLTEPFGTDLCGDNFFTRTLKEWNTLPSFILDQPNADAFKSALKGDYG